MSRPEALFPLFADLEGLPGIGRKLAGALEEGGIETPKDLLFHLPYSGVDRTPRASLQGISPPAVATVEVEVGQHLPARQKGRPYRVEATDAGLTFHLIFFHARRDYLERLLPPGTRRIVSGKVEIYDGVYQMVHPDHVLVPGAGDDLPLYEPVYSLTHGITLKTLTKAIEGAVDRAPELAEWADPALVAERGWPGWLQAVRLAHAPGSGADLSPSAPARERLAYDELFAHQLTLALARMRDRRRRGLSSVATGRLQSALLSALPFLSLIHI